VLYERRGTPVLRSARPELVVPKPWTSWRWTEALNSRLWPRACAATGKRASMVAEPRPPFSPRCLGWSHELTFSHRRAVLSFSKKTLKREGVPARTVPERNKVVV